MSGYAHVADDKKLQAHAIAIVLELQRDSMDI
jgi:hypothetical protein